MMKLLIYGFSSGRDLKHEVSLNSSLSLCLSVLILYMPPFEVLGLVGALFVRVASNVLMTVAPYASDYARFVIVTRIPVTISLHPPLD